MWSLRHAQTPEDLSNILALQQANMKAALSEEEKKKEGFITVQHTHKQLEEMAALAPQIVAYDGDVLAGFALVMSPEMRDTIPVLRPLFALIDNLTFNDKPLAQQQYYVMGQVCVHKEYRGKGVFKALYAHHKNVLSEKYSCCITEISTANRRSMRAHEKVGFQNIHTYTDPLDEWHVVLWDWR